MTCCMIVQQSVAVLEDAIKDKPTVAMLLMLGDTYMKASNWHAAIVNLNRTIQLIVSSLRTERFENFSLFE